MSRCDAQGICQVIDINLRPYHTLVDARSEKCINNYADGALLIASSSGKTGRYLLYSHNLHALCSSLLIHLTDTSKWKSNLRNNRPVLSIVDQLTNCPGKCSTFEVAEQDLKLLGNAYAKATKDENIQSLGGFVPKKSGKSVHVLITLQLNFAIYVLMLNIHFPAPNHQFGLASKEQSQKSTVSGQQGPSSGLQSRGNSFDSFTDKRVPGTGFGFGKWQPQPHPKERGGLTCTDSGDTRPNDINNFGRKATGPQNIFARNVNGFGTRGGNPHTVYGSSSNDEINFNSNVEVRNMGGPPQMCSATWKGASHNTYK